MPYMYHILQCISHFFHSKSPVKSVCVLLNGTPNFHFLTTFSEYLHFRNIFTPDRRQSKRLLTIDEHESEIARNSVFHCHLSPVWRQMAIENSVSKVFDLRSSIVLTFLIVAYPV